MVTNTLVNQLLKKKKTLSKISRTSKPFLLLFLISTPAQGQTNGAIFQHKGYIAEQFTLAHIKLTWNIADVFVAMASPCNCSEALREDMKTHEELTQFIHSAESLDQVCEANTDLVHLVETTFEDMGNRPLFADSTATIDHSLMEREIITAITVGVLLIGGASLAYGALLAAFKGAQIAEQAENLELDMTRAKEDFKIINKTISQLGRTTQSFIQHQIMVNLHAACMRQANTARILALQTQGVLSALINGRVNTDILALANLGTAIVKLRHEALTRGFNFPLKSPGQLVNLPMSFSHNNGVVIMLIHIPIYKHRFSMTLHMNFPVQDKNGTVTLIQPPSSSAVVLENNFLVQTPNQDACITLDHTKFCPFTNVRALPKLPCLSALHGADPQEIGMNCKNYRSEPKGVFYAQQQDGWFSVYAHGPSEYKKTCNQKPFAPIPFQGFQQIKVSRQCSVTIGQMTLLPLHSDLTSVGISVHSFTADTLSFPDTTSATIQGIEDSLANLHHLQEIHADPLHPQSNIFKMGVGIGGVGLLMVPIVATIVWIFYKKAARYADQTNPTIKVNYVPGAPPVVATA